MEFIIFMLIFYGAPIIAIIVSFYKLSQYRNAKLQRIIKPESYTDKDVKDMKKGVATSFIVSTILTVVNLTILTLLGNAIAHM